MGPNGGTRDGPLGPLVVGIGGSTREPSSSEALLRVCLSEAELLGARVRAFSGTALRLPLYEPDYFQRSDEVNALIESLRDADGVVVVSPGYHGGISGMVKNALDYVEDLRVDERPYLDGRAVGCVACAAGWQAAGTTLQALRAVVHALRGWPTPLGVAVNSEQLGWTPAGKPADQGVALQLKLVAEQVIAFAASGQQAASEHVQITPRA
jgi:FMN reductase